jgi:hypothetical protein
MSDRKVRQTLLPVVSYSSSAGFRECRGRLPHLGGETAPGAGAHAPSDGAVPARVFPGLLLASGVIRCGSRTGFAALPSRESPSPTVAVSSVVLGRAERQASDGADDDPEEDIAQRGPDSDA